MTVLELFLLLFDRQRELMREYKQIEQLPDAPVPLHTTHGQRVIKDFAWRYTEEMVEALDADDAASELADALHFLVELLLFAGVSPEQCAIHLQARGNWPPQPFEPHQPYWSAVVKLGVAMNYLRARPWKRSIVPTDEGRFRLALLDAVAAHCVVWAREGFAPADIAVAFRATHDKNVQRLRENY